MSFFCLICLFTFIYLAFGLKTIAHMGALTLSLGSAFQFSFQYKYQCFYFQGTSHLVLFFFLFTLFLSLDFYFHHLVKNLFARVKKLLGRFYSSGHLKRAPFSTPSKDDDIWNHSQPSELWTWQKPWVNPELTKSKWKYKSFFKMLTLGQVCK